MLSIKPVDLQVMIPKTTEVSKIYSEENNKNFMNQHHAATSFQQQTEQSLKKVNATNEAFKGKIKEKQKDEKEGQAQEKKNRKGQKDGKQHQQKGNSQSKASTIDIRI